jgi:hypothetical protein
MEEPQAGRPGVALKVQGFLPKTLLGRLGFAGAGLALLGLAFAQPAVGPRREITLSALSVPLSVNEPGLDRVGALRFKGGLSLKSADEGFGGLSGLSVEETDGEVAVLAVTDQGDKFSGRLMLRGDQLRGIESASLEPLADLEGKPVSGKLFGDAESITRFADGRVLVGFERRHRIWVYGPGLTGPAKAFDTPHALADAPQNGGLESLSAWPDGRLLAITEQMKTASGNLAAFLFQAGGWSDLQWKASAPGFEPSDATVLPGGDLLVLERFWSARAPTDVRSRISRVRRDSVKAGAVLEGELLAELKAPLTVENFEGIAVFTGGLGATQILLVSDNNFSPAQRTLLLWFEIAKN